MHTTRALVLAAAAVALSAGCTRQEIDRAGSSLASSAPALASDGLIIAKIETKFIGIDGDSALHVAVASHDGRVRLSGRTKSAAISQRYVAAAKDVAGVKDVAASLEADPTLSTTSQKAADFALAIAVRANVLGQAGINGGVDLDIAASGGVVTLRGRVKTAALHATIVDAAKTTKGVASVDDELKVDS